MFPRQHSVAIIGTLCIAVALEASFASPGQAAQPNAATPISADQTNAQAEHSAAVVSLNGPMWSLAPDPKNEGRDQKWWEKPVAGAKTADVPCTIQEVFPGCHGVAWYWREFTAPANPHADGRYLLRFWGVDYLADVWVNDVYIGQHEGANDPFTLDATKAIKPQAVNRIAVRVLNPTSTPIDGVLLPETAHTSKNDGGLNWGGLMDSVELLVVPVVRVEDLFIRPDPKTGRIRVQVNLRNAGAQAVRERLSLSVAPASGGEILDAVRLDRELPPGDTVVEATLQVEHLRLWELNDPYLYRVAARVNSVKNAEDCDERAARCGFRDFRFENGYFRLNGRRIFLRSALTCGDTPATLTANRDPELPRRDLINCKAMGFNMVRFLTGVSNRFQFDMCDEIGLLIYQENYASWCMQASAKLAERFDRSTAAMVQRDRNHPSVVMWGILNETFKGPVFDHAATVLPLVHSLDDTRMVMLSSGGWDKSGLAFANPGDAQWQNTLFDQHPYQQLPHNAGVINTLRTLNDGSKSVFISEYGIGSAQDVVRITRHFEQLGKTSLGWAVPHRQMLDAFMADWNRWNLGGTFANPEDYFQQCEAWMAGLRKLGVNAIRANPRVVGYSMTALQDPIMSGEGLTTLFRELKPGTVDAMFDAFAPLRFCLFVEPVQAYRGQKVRLEAVLANEDVLAPGDYPVRLQVVAPNRANVFDRTISLTIPNPKDKAEPGFTLPVFADDVLIDGPAGKYRFLATFQRGAAAAGSDVEFYVADPAEMPRVDSEIVLWGDDAGLGNWLNAHGVKTRAFAPESSASREVILVGNSPAAGGAEAFRELAKHIARGSHAVFLCPKVFAKGDDPTGWLPLANKGILQAMPAWLYHKDDWAKSHPIFDGLPAGGILDHTFYREMLVNVGFTGQDPPAEAVAGSIDTSQLTYGSWLTMAVYNFGEGHFTLNTFQIRETLGVDPVAERLLRNMLRYAARDVSKPLVELPANFDQQLKAMGY